MSDNDKEYIAECGSCPWQAVGDDRTELDDQAERHTDQTKHATIVGPLTSWEARQ